VATRNSKIHSSCRIALPFHLEAFLSQESAHQSTQLQVVVDHQKTIGRRRVHRVTILDFQSSGESSRNLKFRILEEQNIDTEVY